MCFLIWSQNKAILLFLYVSVMVTPILFNSIIVLTDVLHWPGPVQYSCSITFFFYYFSEHLFSRRVKCIWLSNIKKKTLEVGCGLWHNRCSRNTYLINHWFSCLCILMLIFWSLNKPNKPLFRYSYIQILIYANHSCLICPLPIEIYCTFWSNLKFLKL